MTLTISMPARQRPKWAAARKAIAALDIDHVCFALEGVINDKTFEDRHKPAVGAKLRKQLDEALNLIEKVWNASGDDYRQSHGVIVTTNRSGTRLEAGYWLEESGEPRFAHDIYYAIEGLGMGDDSPLEAAGFEVEG